MELGLTLVGLSHRTAALEVRERYVVSQDDLGACLAAITSIAGVKEAFVLSTCNRTEALVVGEPEQDLAPALRAHLFRNLGDEQIYVWRGVQALIHVFRVASGLDSLVIGESEVLGQIRRGVDVAQRSGTLGGTLRPLLQQALHVGKRVRTETDVGRGTLSVARVAVDVAAQVFGRFDHCRALVVGAGETGILVARHLVDRGLKSLTFANRTLARAREAAAEFGGRAFGLEDVRSLAGEADIVVACIEGAGNQLGPDAFDKRAMRKRDRPLLAVDLSVPRAIDRSLTKLPNLLLYDIDDLQRVVQENRLGRTEATESSSEILVAELHKFVALRAYASFTPAIAAMRERFEQARDEVLDCVAGASSDKKNLQIAHDLSRRLLDIALDHMKEGARATSSEQALDREYRRFLQNLRAGERGWRVVLATRGSSLALWQAEEARRLLRIAHPEADVQLSVVQSTGDKDSRSDLSGLGRTGVFTAELDRAVLDGAADVGVHSLKDMTTSLLDGLILAGTLARGAAEDALVSRDGRRLAELRSGALVATGSCRRVAMLKRVRPDLEFLGMRGNVDTRLSKLEQGAADALVVACAGLERLGLQDRITEVLGPPTFLPAIGQGIVGLTCRVGDEKIGRTLASISDREAWSEALAERALLRGLHGGCNAPVGARARAVENGLSLRACVLSRDGSRCLEGERSGSIADAEDLGRRLAEDLAARGARELIEAARTV